MAIIEPRQLDIDGEAVALRCAAPADAAALLAFLRRVLEESDDLLMTPDEFDYTIEKEVDWINEHNDNPNSIVLVTMHDDKVIGCLDFRHTPRKRQQHYGSFGVSLRRTWRGKGIGSAMIRTMLDWAEAHPLIEKVGLSAFSTNERALELYRRLGFREVGRSPRHYKLGPDKYADNVIMYRFVNQPAQADAVADAANR